MITVLINPIAGGARPDTARRRAELAAGVIRSAGETGEVFVTERRGHARELAMRAIDRGARLVIAWGGDGTLNEVGSALAFKATPLGLVPSGSGNGLARELGVAKSADHAIAEAMRATPKAIDVGEVDGRLFFNIAGIGFDAHVASCLDRNPDRRGLAAYMRITAHELRTYRPSSYRIDAETVARQALFVILANSSQFGNGARIAPAARPDDGRLDLVMFEETSRLATICAVPRLFLGGLDRLRRFSTRRFERLVIASDEPMMYHVDGEPVQGGRRLEARVHPAALNVCVR